MLWTRLLRPFRFQPYEGGGGLAARIMHRLRRMRERVFFYAEAYWLVRDFGEEIQVPGLEPGFEYREAGMEDLHLFPPVKAKEAAENLAQGDLCFMALKEGRLAHYHWFRTRASLEGILGIMVEPSGGEVYWSDGYTVPEFRGRKLLSAVGLRAMSLLKQRGFRAAVTVIMTNNRASLRGIAIVGCRVKEKIAVIRWGRKRWLYRFPWQEEV